MNTRWTMDGVFLSEDIETIRRKNNKNHKKQYCNL